MNAFDVLGDPVRRRIIEILADGESTAGQVVEIITQEFGITQAGVSQHLKVLRDSGFASSAPQGSKRIYKLENGGFNSVDEWLHDIKSFWNKHLDALGEELTKGTSPKKN